MLLLPFLGASSVVTLLPGAGAALHDEVGGGRAPVAVVLSIRALEGTGYLGVGGYGHVEGDVAFGTFILLGGHGIPPVSRIAPCVEDVKTGIM
jgi:hypothetical protein